MGIGGEGVEEDGVRTGLNAYLFMLFGFLN